jgi:hypothetical protein
MQQLYCTEMAMLEATLVVALMPYGSSLAFSLLSVAVC